jgi:HlyD family secretion protein
MNNSKQRIFNFSKIGIAVLMVLILGSCQTAPRALKLEDCIVLEVEKGPVFQIIEATGIAVAENEVLIRVPYPGMLKQIYKEPGSRVQKGDVILALDDTSIKTEIDHIRDQLELKKNSIEKNKLNESSATVDLNYSEEVKSMTIKSLRSRLADEIQLLDVGGISPAKIEKTKEEISLAEKDLLMLKQKNTIRIKQLKAEEQGLILGIQIQEKELADKLHFLSLMRIEAPSPGIILSISNKVGEYVNAEISQNSVLVRMSDLSSFKIMGSAEDKYAEYIKTGTKVFATIDNERISGAIGIVNPMIEGGRIKFNVHLDDKHDLKLISNQKIAIDIVGSELGNAVRIKHIKSLSSENLTTLYSFEKGFAVRRAVTIGLVNYDFIQIISGLEPGEKIIFPKKGISVFNNNASILIIN